MDFRKGLTFTYHNTGLERGCVCQKPKKHYWLTLVLINLMLNLPALSPCPPAHSPRGRYSLYFFSLVWISRGASPSHMAVHGWAMAVIRSNQSIYHVVYVCSVSSARIVKTARFITLKPSGFSDNVLSIGPNCLQNPSSTGEALTGLQILFSMAKT